jgi:IS1 family transposase
VRTPRAPTTNSWRFPPRTTEVQFDEKWSFVAKKEANCDRDDPADDRKGDCWDHVALDPGHRLVVAVVPGKRTAASAAALVRELHRRTSGRPMALITTDEYAPYREAILQAYGETVTPPRTGRRGRPRGPYKVAPAGLLYATVHKTRRKGRVVKVGPRLVFGTEAALKAALRRSASGRAVNTSFVERQHGTDRNRNARKVRKAYSFSKRWDVHEAITYFTLYTYNFCWPVRTLADRDAAGRVRTRTPAMAAGLADHVWSLKEWLTRPAVHRT